MLDIIATGGYDHCIDPDRGLPDLSEAVMAVCRERFRRIDRYTQLSLIGSGRCLGDVRPDPATGLYVGSRFAALGNTVRVHEQMVLEGLTPKPVHFINTLSNSAGYYVARNLGLTGRNLFVSRGDASLMAALQLALTDLRTGVVKQALLGVVDEAMLPARQHRKRLGIGPDTAVGEGSYWMLLEASGAGAGRPSLDEVHTLPDRAALGQWLARIHNGRTQAPLLYESPHAGPITPESDVPLGHGWRRFDPGLDYSPAIAAGAVLRYLESGETAPLACVVPDREGRFHVLRCRASANRDL